MAPRGAGRPKISAWAYVLGIGLPLSAALLWIFWSPLVAAAAPTVIPTIGPILPKPEGAPATAKASWDPELGVIWRDCREAAGGQVTAEWWSDGFHRAWVLPAAHCGAYAHDETAGALRLSGRGTPILVLDRLSAPPQASMRRVVCDEAAGRGLQPWARVAAAANRPEAGADLQRVLGEFTALEPQLKWARPGGQVISSQVCNFRNQPPPRPGEVPPAIMVNRGPSWGRPD